MWAGIEVEVGLECACLVGSKWPESCRDQKQPLQTRQERRKPRHILIGTFIVVEASLVNGFQAPLVTVLWVCRAEAVDSSTAFLLNGRPIRIDEGRLVRV